MHRRSYSTGCTINRVFVCYGVKFSHGLCRFRNDLLDNNVAHELIIYSVHLARPAPNDALNRLGTPAERMEVPADVDTVTYANADLTETINAFKQYGVRLLTPDEISKEMPDYSNAMSADEQAAWIKTIRDGGPTADFSQTTEDNYQYSMALSALADADAMVYFQDHKDLQYESAHAMEVGKAHAFKHHLIGSSADSYAYSFMSTLETLTTKTD